MGCVVFAAALLWGGSLLEACHQSSSTVSHCWWGLSMRGGVVSGGLLCGRPPDGASCSRRAGLHQCKSFVEICIVTGLSATAACSCVGGLQSGAALVVVCLAVVTLPPDLPHQLWLVVVWLAVVSSADDFYAVSVWPPALHRPTD